MNNIHNSTRVLVISSIIMRTASLKTFVSTSKLILHHEFFLIESFHPAVHNIMKGIAEIIYFQLPSVVCSLEIKFKTELIFDDI